MGRIGFWEILVVFVVIILVFGVKRLPEIGRSLGKAINEFRKAGKEAQNELNKGMEEDKEG